MTPTETVQLVEFVHALCPQQAIDRKTPIAWHAVIKDLDFRAAQAAVIALKHSQKFIDVADIVTQARNSADLHPSSRTVAEAFAFANLRELDPAGGAEPAEEYVAVRKALDERLAARAAGVPRKGDWRLAVACPWCLASPGEPCVNAGTGIATPPHQARAEAASRPPGGGPP